jgi:hypothetical protein
MAITYTQADLDALNQALLTGAEEVTIGDRKIKYRSQEHLLALIKMVQAAVEGTDQSTDSPNIVQATYSKGRS